MEAKIRRLENNLVTIGTGVVILSLWTLFKTILYVYIIRIRNNGFATFHNNKLVVGPLLKYSFNATCMHFFNFDLK